MLTTADLKEKHLLFIQTERGKENKIKFWNENIRFTKDGILCGQIPCHNVFSLFIIGDISLTSQIINKCQKYGISLFLMDYKLKQYASISSQLDGNYLLRSRQYLVDKNKIMNFSKYLIANKIDNQGKLIKDSKVNLTQIKEKIKKTKDLQELLGIEGSYSKKYFESYFKELGWKRRQPRAKQDMVNLLLDIGYYYLFNITDSLLRAYGFDTYKGIYHQLFFERKSLACDIMEPFRCLIDKSLKKAYHLRMIKENDFKFINGRYELNYAKSSYYAEIFLQTIMLNIEDFHVYIKKFYKYILGSTEIPYFTLKERD